MLGGPPEIKGAYLITDRGPLSMSIIMRFITNNIYLKKEILS